MVTHFMTTEVRLQTSPLAMHQAIEAALKAKGELLRWAITRIDVDQQIAYVEAVVTVGQGFG
jgi:hypothetical protein